MTVLRHGRSDCGGGGVSIEQAREEVAAAAWADLPVEHLQLAPRVSEGLRKRGINTVGEALAFSRSSMAFQFPYAPELFESARQAATCTDPTGIGWRRYWQLRDNRFQQLAATLPEFDRLAEELAAYAIDRRSLGNAGAMLQAGRIRTFPQLIARLRNGFGPVRGIGHTKIAELFGRLLDLAEQLERGRPPALNRLPQTESGNDEASVEAALRENAIETPLPSKIELPDEVRRLPISVLQIGPKSWWLRDAGIQTIGDLSDFDPVALKRMKAIGPRTLKSIQEKLEELSRSSADGHVDWQAFSRHSGLPLLPAEPLSSASEMLARLPEIMEAVGPHLRDDSYRAILFQRLTRGPGAQSTLEELARRASPPVTRERIRQKEKKLLRQLAGALVWDVDGRLGVQFHPTMLEFWRQAASEFEGEEEIRFDQFVARLSAVWRVEREALIRELPFIVALVTGEPQLPASFRAGARMDPVLFRISAETSAVPLTSLRIGRLENRLRSHGITTIGGLVSGAVDGLNSAEIGSALADVTAALMPDGSFDWNRYVAAIGLTLHPATSPANAAQFASSFCDTSYALLARLHSSDRRPTIFRLRTSQSVRSRPTLDAVSKMLRTHGPTVKREETLLLQELHDILVDRDFSTVPLWLDSKWLRYVRECQTVFENCGRDYAVFLSRLAETWDLGIDAAEEAAPALWAIFTGYPEGRRHRRVSVDNIAPVEPAKIRLRGFQRLH